MYMSRMNTNQTKVRQTTRVSRFVEVKKAYVFDNIKKADVAVCPCLLQIPLFSRIPDIDNLKVI